MNIFYHKNVKRLINTLTTICVKRFISDSGACFLSLQQLDSTMSRVADLIRLTYVPDVDTLNRTHKVTTSELDIIMSLKAVCQGYINLNLYKSVNSY